MGLLLTGNGAEHAEPLAKPKSGEKKMTIEDVREMVAAESEMDDAELIEAFRAVYERTPDAEDERAGLHSLIVAGI